MTVMTDPLLSPAQLSAYAGVPLATIYQMNSRGTGPRRIRVGKHVRYRKSDVDAWLEQNVVREVV
jgi:excisionase family DNA binding protein